MLRDVDFNKTVNRSAIGIAIAIAVGVAIGLLGASAASAQDPSQALVCGISLDLRANRACLIMANQNVHALLGQSEAFVRRSPPRPAPFYRIRFLFSSGRPSSVSYLYIPSREMIRVTSRGSPDHWSSAPTTFTRAFHKLSKRIRPFRTPAHWR
jgi:hypothetical protein